MPWSASQKDGEDYVTGTTDVLGQVSLDFLPVSTGTAVLTVTGKNLRADGRVPFR